MKKYTLEITVSAQQFDGSDYMIDLWEMKEYYLGGYYFDIYLDDGGNTHRLHIKKGDWIVVFDNDTVHVLSDEDFKSDYKPVDYVERD